MVYFIRINFKTAEEELSNIFSKKIIIKITFLHIHESQTAVNSDKEPLHIKHQNTQSPKKNKNTH